MLKTLRRLLAGTSGQVDSTMLRQWAEEHGHGWRKVRDAEGCVIDGRLGQQPWRIEWGAPQRDYVSGMELRLMAGRTAEVKKELSDRIAAVLKSVIPAQAGLEVQLSVDIVDMDKPSYFKGKL